MMLFKHRRMWCASLCEITTMLGGRFCLASYPWLQANTGLVLRQGGSNNLSVSSIVNTFSALCFGSVSSPPPLAKQLCLATLFISSKNCACEVNGLDRIDFL